MVAIFDYDPRESSPNTDIEVRHASYLIFSFSPRHGAILYVRWSFLLITCLFFFWDWIQAELTFSAGDIIHVFGDMDEDGFFYVSVTVTLESGLLCLSDEMFL